MHAETDERNTMTDSPKDKDNLRSIPVVKSLEAVEAEAALVAIHRLVELSRDKNAENACQAAACILIHMREKENMALHRIAQNIDDERSAELRVERENRDAERLKDQESKRMLIEQVTLIAPILINKLIGEKVPVVAGAVSSPSRADAWGQLCDSFSSDQTGAFSAFLDRLTPKQKVMFYTLLEIDQ